ncbi:porin [Halarcobacter ebronensis]|uniref:porin n=1 Tax=Halarcobacter ebronensis TaxID=1462615 RepID=UPI003C75A2F6
MKKFAKMSLVAALAVAGTAASAQPLAEAIKNVDVSGTVVYRYNDYNFENDAKSNNGGNSLRLTNATDNRDNSTNNYKIGLTAKAKVNDDVTAVTRFLVTNHAGGSFTTLDYANNGGDGQVDVVLNQVYFSYTGIANTTVNVGKQGLTTPWTVAIDADSNEQTGTGILALTNVGPVTLAGAYFNQTNLYAADANVITVGAMANVGPVALDAWYLDYQDEFDTYTVGAAANFDLDAVKLSLGARHTSIDLDKSQTLFNTVDADKNDHELTKVEAGLKAGIFGANVGYGWTDKEGGVAALDADAKTGFQGWNLNLNGVADADLLKTSVSAQVLPSLKLSLNYNVLDTDIDNGSDTKDTELYLQADYKMSKNFGGYIRFGQAEFEDDYTDEDGDVEDNKGTVGRIQVQYSF